MRQDDFDREMLRIKNQIEKVKRQFRMKPQVEILVNRQCVYQNNHESKHRLDN